MQMLKESELNAAICAWTRSGNSTALCFLFYSEWAPAGLVALLTTTCRGHLLKRREKQLFPPKLLLGRKHTAILQHNLMFLLKLQEMANSVGNVFRFFSLNNVQYLAPDGLGKHINKPQ